ncbi:hypothetical protein [Campylobacter helveticus]|uniref:hypothetical protein n=1 Tax=Campylobacter helveticus TaxID=28898 RepID=UPI0022EA9551|nr:hypothetical protein [Campylobacter helveticus]
MSLAKLDNSKDPKIVIVANSALNYVSNKETGELGQKTPKTAAINIIREAGIVSGMDTGTVTVSFKNYGKWQNYFVDRNDSNSTISLRPCDNPKDREGFIYVNAVPREDGKGMFYAFNEKTEAGRNFVQGLSVRDWTNQQTEQVSSYVEGRATLKNDVLKQELLEKGEGHIAILSKNGFEVKLESELNKQNQELHQTMAKENDVQQNVKSVEKQKQPELDMGGR